MTQQLSSLAFALAVALSLLGLATFGGAAQSSSGTGTPPGDIAPGRDPCFQQLLDDLTECEDRFCPNQFSCNHTLLSACKDGAYAAFEKCIQP